VEGYEGWGGYGAAKAAFEQLSRVLAAEEPSLRVWWVDPGDMRTRMHQDAFPGEDISDRPEPSAVVPSLLRLIWEQPPSGRYRAADFPAATVGTATEVASNGMATEFASNGTAAKPVRVEAAR
jgi:NAD(P)-dependent dehydrogenase (short-subunit alcohol dehydrogenase family)